MKSPEFKLHVADFLVGTATMTAEETGAYIRLLCFQWDHGSIPNDKTAAARLGGCGEQAIKTVMKKFAICINGRRMNERMEKTRAKIRPTKKVDQADLVAINAPTLEQQANEIYEAYPRKTSRAPAIAAIKRALESTGFEVLLACTKRYALARKGEDPTFTPYPATWFNQQRYNDDPATWGRVQSEARFAENRATKDSIL